MKTSKKVCYERKERRNTHIEMVKSSFTSFIRTIALSKQNNEYYTTHVIPTWCHTGGRYLGPLRMMSGVRSLIMCMEEYMLGEVNPFNGSQYLERLVSQLRVEVPGFTQKTKKQYTCYISILIVDHKMV